MTSPSSSQLATSSRRPKASDSPFQSPRYVVLISERPCGNDASLMNPNRAERGRPEARQTAWRSLFTRGRFWESSALWVLAGRLENWGRRRQHASVRRSMARARAGGQVPCWRASTIPWSKASVPLRQARASSPQRTTSPSSAREVGTACGGAGHAFPVDLPWDLRSLMLQYVNRHLLGIMI